MDCSGKALPAAAVCDGRAEPPGAAGLQGELGRHEHHLQDPRPPPLPRPHRELHLHRQDPPRGRPQPRLRLRGERVREGDQHLLRAAAVFAAVLQRAPAAALPGHQHPAVRVRLQQHGRRRRPRVRVRAAAGIT